jgi:hypothetical protein
LGARVEAGLGEYRRASDHVAGADVETGAVPGTDDDVPFALAFG